MRGRRGITTQSESMLEPMRQTIGNSRLARMEMRSLLYRIISSLFSDPDSERFSRLSEFREGEIIGDACETVGDGLRERAEALLDYVVEERGAVRRDHIRLFGHTASKELSLYELEHRSNLDVFNRTQSLSDINGFYRAFGLEIKTGERADHISVELEFLGHLILLENQARQRRLVRETEVAAEAHASFWRDHFAGWTGLLLQNLEHSDSYYYREASIFTHRFMLSEELHLSMRESAAVIQEIGH